MIKPPNNSWWENALPEVIKKRQASQLHKYLRDRVLPFSAYYRKLFSDLHLTADDIRSTDDLIKLPFTQKSDLSEARDFVIIPDEAILKKQPSTFLKLLRYGPKGVKLQLADELRPIHMTSTTGRSSKPVPFLYTKYDLANLEATGLRLMQLSQAESSFRIVNSFPFAPHLAFWQAWYAALGNTCFTLSTGGGKVMGTAGNVKVIDTIQPDAIIAMPTFLYHMLQFAESEGMRWTNLKRLVLGGEKVPLGMRKKLRELTSKLGSPDVDIISTYGFTEAKMAFSECRPGKDQRTSGFHIYPDLAFIEVIDPTTGERVPDESPGEIVFTSLDSRGSVVIRYRTGDLIEGGITYQPCPICHRTCPRLLGRISRVSEFKNLQIDKLKGTMVDFNSLEHVLDDTDGVGAWQIELRKENDDPLGLDIINIHVVAMQASESSLTEIITRRLRDTTELSPNAIIFHSWDEMRKLQGVGIELKEQKIIDNRPE